MSAPLEEYFLYNGNVRMTYQDDRHRYTAAVKQEDGKFGRDLWVPSATNIGNVYDGGKAHNLAKWRARLISEELYRLLEEKAFQFDEVDFAELWEKAMVEPDAYTKRSTSIGDKVHGHAEDFLNSKINGTPFKPKKYKNKEINNCISGIEQWWEEEGHKWEWIASERKCYSVKHHFAGTLDAMGIDPDGRVGIIDFKTGKSVYDSHRFQIASYALMVEEEDNLNVDRRLILHLKKSKARNGKQYTPYDLDLDARFTGATKEEDIKAFLGLRQVFYRTRELQDR